MVMPASSDETAGKVKSRRDEFYPLVASLIRAERTHRQARSISYRIGGAKFPVLKDLDSFVFADTPVDQGQVRELKRRERHLDDSVDECRAARAASPPRDATSLQGIQSVSPAAVTLQTDPLRNFRQLAKGI